MAKAAAALIVRADAEVIVSKTSGCLPTGNTPLITACEGSDGIYEKAAIVDELVDRRSDVEARGPNGNAPLLLAAATGVADAVERPPERRAAPRALNERDQGELRQAKMQQHNGSFASGS